MHFKIFLIPSILILQFADAQTGTASLTTAQAPSITPVSAASSTPVMPAETPAAPDVSPTGEVRIVDYKSVFEAATVEEEVKMASERFSLTPSQQEMWLVAATERRVAEKQAREKLDSKDNYMKEPIYRGLKSSLNTFHETVTGHLTPAQKQSLETDRLILEEKRQRLAKLPPPAAPAVTVAPVDSAAIKQEAEKDKPKGKKSKKKKKAVAQ